MLQFKKDDPVTVSKDHPDGRFASGDRRVASLGVIGGRSYLGLTAKGGALVWIPADSPAVTLANKRP